VEKSTSANLAIELFLTGTIERKHACKHDKKYDTQGPYVCGETRILFFLNDLWGHIGGRATEDLELCIVCLLYSEAEVNDFNVISIIYDYIF